MLHQTTAMLIVEAECLATSQNTKETIRLRQLLMDVGCLQGVGRTIMCDNQKNMSFM